jgi:hypothetical protein
MKRVRDQGRQGDVLLTRVSALPGICADVPPTNGKIVIAYGEMTGHAHAMPSVDARLLDYRGGMDVDVTGTSAQPLFHEEHETLLLGPGIYSVRIQRQHFNGIHRWLGTYGLD